MYFTSLEKFELAVELFVNLWKRNNSLDPDLDLQIKCSHAYLPQMVYKIEFIYTNELAPHNPTPYGKVEDDQYTTKDVCFSMEQSDEQLELLVFETLDELRNIKVKSAA